MEGLSVSYAEREIELQPSANHVTEDGTGVALSNYGFCCYQNAT